MLLRAWREKKQILYLLGPVGGGKSSLAERLKSLMQRVPIYVLSANGERSPVNDHPLCLFNPQEDAQILDKEYGIPRRYLGTIMSPWAAKTPARVWRRHHQIPRGESLAVYPGTDCHRENRTRGMRTTRTSPLWWVKSISVSWKTSRRMTRMPTVTPARAVPSKPGDYGVRRDVFKAPIKVLHPLLTATQEGNYNGTEGISALPFNGIILAHSNESEWVTFRNNKNNEAFP